MRSLCIDLYLCMLVGALLVENYCVNTVLDSNAVLFDCFLLSV